MSPKDATPPGRHRRPDEALGGLLARGVAEGVITEDQATRLAALGRARADVEQTDLPQDDERLRFITGFADIFVTIGLGLFLGASAYFGLSTLGRAGGYALVAALAWGLAEFFSRRRRMALPSIVLLAVFAVSSFFALLAAFGVSRVRLFAGGAEFGTALSVAAAAAATLALAALHYRRFRVPVTVAAGMAALIGAVLALLLAAFPGLETRLDLLLAGAGLATFALAMRFDLSDPNRLTRRSDIAFWLHLLAAPLIVHPVLSDLVWEVGPVVPIRTALIVLGVVLLLSLVALVTDRRAILVSGLIYAGVAVGSLVREVGLTESLPLSLLTLGAFVLLLSAGWHPLREGLLRALPERIRLRLPRPVMP